MSKLVFKPEDFRLETLQGLVGAETLDRARKGIAEKANIIYEIHIETLPKVYGFKDDGGFILSERREDYDTHTARLIDITEIPKVECNHKNVYQKTSCASLTTEHVCADCGASVRPRGGWEKCE